MTTYAQALQKVATSKFQTLICAYTVNLERKEKGKGSGHLSNNTFDSTLIS